jgi:sugar/nucleoside kinase (ribokinase family)
MKYILALAAGSAVATLAVYAKLLSDPVAFAGLVLRACSGW